MYSFIYNNESINFNNYTLSSLSFISINAIAE